MRASLGVPVITEIECLNLSAFLDFNNPFNNRNKSPLIKRILGNVSIIVLRYNVGTKEGSQLECLPVYP